MPKLPIAYEGDRPYIFISYAHKNSETVIPAVRALGEAGFPVWYDAGIQAGTEWPEYIAEHLLKSALVIAFISKESIASPNCRQEIAFALDNNKPMLTVRLDEAVMSPGMQMRLNLCQALMAYRHTTQEGYINELVRAPFIASTLQMAPDLSSAPVVNEAAAPVEAAPAGTTSASAVKEGAFMEKLAKKLSEASGKTVGEESLWGVLCYLSALWLIPLLMKKKSEFVRFHINQGLLCTAVWFGLCLVGLLFSGSYVLSVFFRYLRLFEAIAAMIFGIVNALRSRKTPLPLIGKYQIVK